MHEQGAHYLQESILRREKKKRNPIYQRIQYCHLNNPFMCYS